MEERKVEKFVLVNDLRRLTLRLFNYYTADPRLLFLEHSLPYPADFYHKQHRRFPHESTINLFQFGVQTSANNGAPCGIRKIKVHTVVTGGSRRSSQKRQMLLDTKSILGMCFSLISTRLLLFQTTGVFALKKAAAQKTERVITSAAEWTSFSYFRQICTEI